MIQSQSHDSFFHFLSQDNKTGFVLDYDSLPGTHKPVFQIGLMYEANGFWLVQLRIPTRGRSQARVNGVLCGTHLIHGSCKLNSVSINSGFHSVKTQTLSSLGRLKPCWFLEENGEEILRRIEYHLFSDLLRLSVLPPFNWETVSGSYILHNHLQSWLTTYMRAMLCFSKSKHFSAMQTDPSLIF